ncbi:MAG: DNA mismatch repair endonuclease MutL [Clostridia bacterium]
MAKIKVLDKHVAELIAAGEVVERPASVVKELVENSIDAGSNSITVEIRQGGISYIRISDNGCGIEKDDVPVAFLRHATSKVTNAHDLDSIGSLGFRGEALASISAVSKVELSTKTKNSVMGTTILISGGDIEEIREAGLPNGTTIVVKDIFYNVPARMKFLKKDVSEGNAVASVMDKLALSHPEISFRFIRDRKEVMFTPGDSKLASAIYGVFGKAFTQTLMPISYEMLGIKMWGYISKTSAARPNRSMQSFFINGRFVKSKTAMVALDEALKGSVQVGKYAACVLHFEMDFSLIDVNVHPAKLDVRFVNEKPIFDVVYHGVKSALLKNDNIKEMTIPKKQINPFQDPEPPKQVEFKQAEFNPVKPIFVQREEKAVTFSDSQSAAVTIPPIFVKLEEVIDSYVTPEPVIKDEYVKIDSKEAIQKHSFINEKNALEPEDIQEYEDFLKTEDEKEEPVEIKELSYHKLIGEAFNTYIIIEYKKGLMFIDKHAAHERLLYEKLKKNNSEQYQQVLLIPVTVSLDKESYTKTLENLDKFKEAGFEIEDFGGSTVIVRTAPLSLIDQDIVSAVIEISGYLAKHINNFTTEHLDWIYHNTACRAAIKGGTKSNDLELIHLAKTLEENPELRHCPHGRPIYVLLSKNELEKQFGRI